VSLLSRTDLEKAAVFLQELYAETRVEQISDVILSGICRLVPCEHSSYNEIDSITNSIVVRLKPVAPEIAKYAPLFKKHFAEHPQLAHYRVSDDRTPYQFTDFLSQRQFRQLGIYRDVYRHLGTEHQMTLVLSNTGDAQDIGIAINRKNACFTERERALLQFLRPHLIQARKNTIAFASAQRKIETLAVSAGDADAGILTLTAEGLPDWGTAKAFELLERYFPGTSNLSAQLPDRLARWVRECRNQLASGEAAAALSSLSIHALGARLDARYGCNLDGSARILLTDKKDVSIPDQTHNLGLTPREAEVLHWIVEGKTYPEIAVILCASPRTVHKHVEHIFSKLGVQTRGGAVREILHRARVG